MVFGTDFLPGAEAGSSRQEHLPSIGEESHFWGLRPSLVINSQGSNTPQALLGYPTLWFQDPNPKVGSQKRGMVWYEPTGRGYAEGRAIMLLGKYLLFRYLDPQGIGTSSCTRTQHIAKAWPQLCNLTAGVSGPAGNLIQLVR